MILQGVLPNGEEELITPPVVVAGIEVEDGRDQGPNVLDGDGLGVEVGDCRSLMEEEGLVKIAVLGDLRVVIRGGVLIGGTVLDAGRTGGRAFLLSMSKGIACEPWRPRAPKHQSGPPFQRRRRAKRWQPPSPWLRG